MKLLSQASELLYPCPHCGSKSMVRLYQLEDHDGFIFPIISSSLTPRYRACCNYCFCMMEDINCEDLVNWWNNRVEVVPGCSHISNPTEMEMFVDVDSELANNKYEDIPIR